MFEPTATLESVVCTEDLNRRPSRPPDHERENSAMVALVQALADSPRSILQTMAAKMLEVLECDSAGFSLLTKDETRFHWAAIAGAWHPHQGGGTPREFGPCGDVLDCNAPLMFRHWERRYPHLLAATPAAEEGLLVPFYVDGKAVGTIWAIAHDERRKFDNEDLRMLVSLATFASAAYQTVEHLQALGEADAREEAAQGIREMNKALRVSSLKQHELAEQVEKAHAVVRESEERYRTLFNLIDEGFCVLEMIFNSQDKPVDYRFLETNPAFEEQSGLIDAVGKRILELAPDIEAHWFEIFGNVSMTGEPVRMTSNMLAFNRWIDLYACRIGPPESRKVGVVFTDVTVRMKVEEALSESEENFQTLFNSIDEGFCVIEMIFDESGKPVDYVFLQVNPAFENQSGIVGATGRRVSELVSGLEQYWYDIYGGVARTGEPVRFTREIKLVDRWFDLYACRVGSPESRRVAVVFSDVTEKHRAQEALEESQRFLRSSLDALSGHIAVLDEKGVILEVNEAWRHFADQNHFIGSDYGIGAPYLQNSNVMVGNDCDTTECAAGINDVISGRRDRFELEYPCHSPTELQWFLMRVTRFKSPGPVRIVVVHDNITERKRAENLLQQNHDTFFNLVENAPFGVYVVDSDFCLRQVSAASRKVFANIDPLLGRDFEEILRMVWPEPFATEAIGRFRHTLKTGEAYSAPNTISQRNNVADVESYDWKIERMTLPDGQYGVVCYFYDNTERKQMEDALAAGEMLKRLSKAQEEERKRVARDIHDQLGQQMTGLRLKLQSIKSICDDRAICDQIDEAQEQAERMDRDVSFLAFELRPSALDEFGLALALGNFVREWSKNYKIAADFYSSKPGRKRLVPDIETNLYRIAQEALNNTVKYAKAKNVSVILEIRKSEVTLILEDDGVGFDGSTLLKNVKKSGRGLGVIGMRERAALIGGTLEIESMPGKGTTIFVRVPISR